MNNAYILRVGALNPEPLDHQPTLAEAQQIVGGFVEQTKLGHSRTIIVNEEGLLQHLPVNELATYEYRRVNPVGLIVGNAIVIEGWIGVK